MGLVLLMALIVGVYLTVQEIDRAMGKGAIFTLFFEPPFVDADRNLTSKRSGPSTILSSRDREKRMTNTTFGHSGQFGKEWR
jgi:hypothetical protein